MKLDELADALSKFDDFQAEKISGRAVERDIAKFNAENNADHCILMVPEFHCELAWVRARSV